MQGLKHIEQERVKKNKLRKRLRLKGSKNKHFASKFGWRKHSNVYQSFSTQRRGAYMQRSDRDILDL